MSDFKFIHCADLHLGSRFVGIEDPNLARKLTESAFDSFSGIVDSAISENADFMVVSGDVFDSEKVSPVTRMRFFSELERASIPCFVARGNHDYRTSWEDAVPVPDNVHVFDTEPESVTLNLKNGGTAEIVGISFQRISEKENLAAKLDGTPGIFTVACVHCDVDGRGDSYYAPCRLTDLTFKNVQYWALGHIHKREIISERPYVVYPGNSQGRHVKESGEKGAYLVTVSGDSVTDLKFIPTQKFVWDTVGCDITGKNYKELVESVSAGLDGNKIVRLKVTGRGTLDSVLRSDPDGFAKAVSMRSGCIVESVVFGSRPEYVPETGNMTLQSKIAETAESLSEKSPEEIREILLSTSASQNHLAGYVSEMSPEELVSVIKDAEFSLLRRIEEASDEN